REEVVPLRDDAGRVLPDVELPDDLAIGRAKRVRLSLECREEHEVPGDERSAEYPASDVTLPDHLPVAGSERAENAVESADEDASPCDCRRRIAVPADVGRPDDVSVAREQRVDLPGAGDREESMAVGRWARVEAVVTERVPFQVVAPDLVPVADA